MAVVVSHIYLCSVESVPRDGGLIGRIIASSGGLTLPILKRLGGTQYLLGGAVAFVA